MVCCAFGGRREGRKEGGRSGEELVVAIILATGTGCCGHQKGQEGTGGYLCWEKSTKSQYYISKISLKTRLHPRLPTPIPFLGN